MQCIVMWHRLETESEQERKREYELNVQSVVLTNDWRCRMAPDAQHRITSLHSHRRQQSPSPRHIQAQYQTQNQTQYQSGSRVDIKGMPGVEELPYFNTSSRLADTPSTMRKPVVSHAYIAPHTPPSVANTGSAGSGMKGSLEHPTVKSLRNSVCEVMKSLSLVGSFPLAAQCATLTIFQR
jgi:hypothetical protein